MLAPMPADYITSFPLLWCRPCGRPTRHRFDHAEPVRLGGGQTGQVDHLLLQYRCSCSHTRVWGMVEPSLIQKLPSQVQ
jgi:hypothetical protein